MGNWFVGLLGVWIMLMAFIIPPGDTHRVLMVLSGAAIVVLVFLQSSKQSGGEAGNDDTSSRP